MVTSLLSKGEPIPPQFMPLVMTVAENMILPLAAENEQQKLQIQEQMRQLYQQNNQQETEDKTEPINEQMSQPAA